MREAGAIILPIPSLVLILFEWAKLIDDALVEIGRWASSMPGDFEVNAVRVLTCAGDRVAVMVGRAGTGKTHTLGTLRTVYETAGWNVIGLAPAARAARELQDGAEITSTTIARHLVEQRDITATTLVVVDEAAMAGSRDVARWSIKPPESGQRSCWSATTTNSPKSQQAAHSEPRSTPSTGGWSSTPLTAAKHIAGNKLPSISSATAASPQHSVQRLEVQQGNLQRLNRRTMSPAEHEALHIELVKIGGELRQARSDRAAEQAFNRCAPNPIDDARSTRIATLAADTLTTQPAWVIDHVRYLHGNQQLTATEPAEPAPESSQRLPTSTRTATSRLPGRRHRHLSISSALLASKSGFDT